MNIDASMDKWVWIAAAIFLVLLGVRAWVVETGRRQLGGAPTTARALTIGTGVVLAVLSTLFMTQAGALLVEAVVTGTNPLVQLGGADAGPDADGLQNPAGAPGDPGAPHGG